MRNNSTYQSLHLLTAILIALTVFTACDQTFSPLKENDRYHFSIFGVMDVSTDTQWVRVMPVRDSFFTSSEPQGAEVSLKHIRTGEVVQMKDSLFELRNNYYAWNYWTTTDIQYGEEYEFRATNTDGESSTVQIFVPEDIQTPVVNYTEGNPVARVNAGPVENLVLVQIVYYFQIDGPEGLSNIHSRAFTQMEDIREASNGDIIIYTYPTQGKNEISRNNNTDITQVIHLRQEVLVVSGGPGWPEVGELTKEERLLPGAISNVEDGLGVLPGIVSKRVPLKSCYDIEGNLVACELIEPSSVVNVKE